MRIRSTTHRGVRQIRGISLVEVLVGLVVLSIGLLAVVRYQVGLSHSAQGSKARAEAVMLAQGKLEEFRNYVTEGQFNTIVNGQEDALIDGVTASFMRRWTADPVTNAGPDRKNVNVAVEWDDPHDGPQVLTLSSIITWRDPAQQLALALDGVDGNDDAVGAPSGEKARHGREGEVRDLTQIDKTNNNDLDGRHDGTYTYYNAETGQYEILDSLGNVKLVIYDGAPITIKGYVYSKRDVGDLLQMTSDFGYCTLNDFGASEAAFRRYTYVCYLAQGWYGRVGLVSRIASKQNTVFACVPNPLMGNNVWNSGAARLYVRETYDETTGAIIKTEGITQNYPNEQYPNHHFVLEEGSCPTEVASVGYTFDTLAPYKIAENGAQTGYTVIQISGTINGVPADLLDTTTVMAGSNFCQIVDQAYQCEARYNTGSYWRSTIAIHVPEGYVCSPSAYFEVVLNSDSNGVYNFECAQAEAGDFVRTVLSGSLTGQQLDTVVLKANEATGAIVDCSVDPVAGTYRCELPHLANGSWIGTLSPQHGASGHACVMTSANVTATGGGTMSGPTVNCPKKIQIYGNATSLKGGRSLTGVTMQHDVDSSYGINGVCELNGRYAGDGQRYGYVCTSDWFTGGHYFRLTYTSNGVVCGGSVYAPAAPLTSDQQRNVSVSNNANGC